MIFSLFQYSCSISRKENPQLTPWALVLLCAYLTARSTLPLRRQRVQTWTRFGEPSTIAATRFTFGFHMRLLRLWEWLTLIPKETPLSQYEHFAIFIFLLFGQRHS